jgi:2-polyprenyl-6-methoxyphenol hydroxylase-like FAD-dependent oxidoreductase
MGTESATIRALVRLTGAASHLPAITDEALQGDREFVRRGRVVLIGDAAHTCPPTIAVGVAMALEDASVLAEMLLTCGRVDQELFDAFVTRRMPRGRAVVEGSMQLVTWQLEHASDADVPGLQRRVYGALAGPA